MAIPKPEEEPIEYTPEQGTPWEATRRAEEERLVKKYEEEAGFGRQLAGETGKVLQEEVDEAEMEYARKWYEDHETDLTKKGIFVKDADPSMIFKTMRENGGLEELRKNPNYVDYNKKVDSLAFLKHQVDADRVTVEGRYLLLNKMYRKAEALNQEVEALRAGGATDEEVEAKMKELDRFENLEEQLASKVIGKDLGKEAEEQAGAIQDKDEYIQENLDAEVANRMTGFDPDDPQYGVSGRDKLQYLNQRRRRKGFFRKRIEITDLNDPDRPATKLKNESEVEAYIEAELNNRFEQEQRVAAHQDLSDHWDNQNEARENAIRDAIAAEVKKYAESPENAEGAVEGMYEQAKQKVLREREEAILGREKKTKQQIEAIKRDFDREGVDLSTFMDAILTRQGDSGEMLEELYGDWDKDSDAVKKFFEKLFEGSQDVDVDAIDFGDAKERLEKQGWDWSRMVQGQRSFLAMMVTLAAAAFDPTKEVPRYSRK